MKNEEEFQKILEDAEIDLFDSKIKENNVIKEEGELKEKYKEVYNDKPLNENNIKEMTFIKKEEFIDKNIESELKQEGKFDVNVKQDVIHAGKNSDKLDVVKTLEEDIDEILDSREHLKKKLSSQEKKHDKLKKIITKLDSISE